MRSRIRANELLGSACALGVGIEGRGIWIIDGPGDGVCYAQFEELNRCSVSPH